MAPGSGLCGPGIRVLTLFFTVLGDSDDQKHIVKREAASSNAEKQNENYKHITISGPSQPSQPAKPASPDGRENHCLGSCARVIILLNVDLRERNQFLICNSPEYQPEGGTCIFLYVYPPQY